MVQQSKFMLTELSMNLEFFKGGILHTLIDEVSPGYEFSNRFRISDHDGVEWS